MFLGGPQISVLLQCMSQHVGGSHHTPAGWDLLLKMDLQRRRSELHWNQEKTAFVGRLPTHESLHRYRREGQKVESFKIPMQISGLLKTYSDHLDLL